MQWKSTPSAWYLSFLCIFAARFISTYLYGRGALCGNKKYYTTNLCLVASPKRGEKAAYGRFFIGMSVLYLLKTQYRLEQIPVHCQLQTSTLKLGEAAGDGKAQTTALCAAGAVAANKAFHELVAGHIQLVL